MPFTVRDLAVRRGGVPVLAIGRLDLAAGTFVSVTGGNGTGKTTLLEALAGLLPFSGSLALAGLPLPNDTAWPAEFRARVAYVPARPHLFRLTVAENVALPLAARGLPPAQSRERALAALGTVGLAALADRDARRLSAGETKRAALARALALDAETLLLDEPTAHVDDESETRIVDLLGALKARPGRTLVFATHSTRQALALADRHLTVVDGGVVEGPRINIFSARITRDGTRAFAETAGHRLPADGLAEGVRTVRIDPHAVRILPPDAPAGGAAIPPGIVTEVSHLGGSVRVGVDLAGLRLAAFLPAGDYARQPLLPGERARLDFRLSEVTLL